MGSVPAHQPVSEEGGSQGCWERSRSAAGGGPTREGGEQPILEEWSCGAPLPGQQVLPPGDAIL